MVAKYFIAWHFHGQGWSMNQLGQGILIKAKIASMLMYIIFVQCCALLKTVHSKAREKARVLAHLSALMHARNARLATQHST